MRIALTQVFSWPEVRRGGERLVAELSSALARAGHDVTTFSCARAPGRSHRGGVTEVRFRRWRGPTYSAEADFGLRVLPALAAGRFDVVHSFGRRDGVASIRAARAHPGRVTVHTDIGVPSRAWWEHQGKEAGYAARVIHDVDVYVCMSQFALDHLREDYGRDGVVIPGGVDLTAFRPAPRRTEHPTILYSGAITEPRKGVATLLEALPLVAREEPDVRLLLSGPGDAEPLLAAAHDEARARTDVLGTGTLEEQPQRYGEAWTCALPSIGDTFGLVLVEALACGTPVVAADNSALPELVDPGVNGALCKHGDPASLAEACVAAIALARRSGTVEACRASVGRFDWRSSIAPRYLEVYEGGTAG